MRFLTDKEIRIPSTCGITGIMNQSGKVFSGDTIYRSICNMKERGNGLGSGYAGYGIYPNLKDYWCFHIMYQTGSEKEDVEEYIAKNFSVIHTEPISTSKVVSLRFVPKAIWRYFLTPKEERMEEENLQEADFVVKSVMDINRSFNDAFVFSSGKNMGVFKGVGDPDEIGDFYRIPEYKGYTWIAHNRFPTNTPGWWGGAHPFSLLDWSLIHNGEISSYGTNRRFLETHGYYCTMFTDTEVMVYLFDLLVRKHGLDFEVVGNILSAPFWPQIERVKDENTKEFLKALRIIYSPALVNGPYAVIVAHTEYMIGLNDRIKLRPLVAGIRGDFLYISSEESAIRIVEPKLDAVWMPNAGEPVIGMLRTKEERKVV